MSCIEESIGTVKELPGQCAEASHPRDVGLLASFPKVLAIVVL
jgi:hypothetical protein